MLHIDVLFDLWYYLCRSKFAGGSVMSAFEQLDQQQQAQGDQDYYEVLVVDDDQAIRKMLHEFFELEGIHGKYVSSAAEAREHIGSSEIVLTDLEMPMEGGEAVAAHMHTIQEGGKDPGDLVLMTGNIVRAGRLRAGEDDLGHPLAAVIDKPFLEIDILLTTIAERLKLRRQQQDAEA